MRTPSLLIFDYSDAANLLTTAAQRKERYRAWRFNYDSPTSFVSRSEEVSSGIKGDGRTDQYSRQRRRVHLAGVIACNFANYLW